MRVISDIVAERLFLPGVLGSALNSRLYDLGVQRICLLNFAGWIEAQFRSLKNVIYLGLLCFWLQFIAAVFFISVLTITVSFHMKCSSIQYSFQKSVKFLKLLSLVLWGDIYVNGNSFIWMIIFVQFSVPTYPEEGTTSIQYIFKNSL